MQKLILEAEGKILREAQTHMQIAEIAKEGAGVLSAPTGRACPRTRSPLLRTRPCVYRAPPGTELDTCASVSVCVDRRLQGLMHTGVCPPDLLPKELQRAPRKGELKNVQNMPFERNLPKSGKSQ